MVFTRDSLGRPVCARPGSSSVPGNKARPTYVASCLPGLRWEDMQICDPNTGHCETRSVCVPEKKPSSSAPPSSASFQTSQFRPTVAGEFFAGPKAAALMHCAPLPWGPKSADAVARLVRARVLANQVDPDRLALTALVGLYPVTREGVAIDWANLPASAAVCLLELRRLVRALVDRVLAEFALEAAQQRYRAAAGVG